MNDVIVSMVDKLFANVWENEEITALREEITANCLERYADHLAKGKTEEEAMEAVRESLAGMEEVVASFPQKLPDPDTLRAEEKPEPVGRMAARDFDAIEAELACFDLKVYPSKDGEIHLETDDAIRDCVTLEREGTRLVLRETSAPKRQQPQKSASEESLTDFVLRQVMGAISRSIMITTLSGEIRLGLPRELKLPVRIGTASGDVDWQGVQAESLTIRTMSGDIAVADVSGAVRLDLDTKSGDMRIRQADCADTRLKTISGDIGWRGSCRELSVNTISGDIHAVGSFLRTKVQTVSGDLRLESADDQVAEITASTTSGDLELRLPHSMNVQANFSSVSGSKRCAAFGGPDGKPVKVSARTVSGDLEIL